MIASCEIDQSELQKLLYDLEAGMPFLFIDQTLDPASAYLARLRRREIALLLAVSGQWPGAK